MVGALVMDRRRTAEACDVLTQLADSLPAGLTKLLGISHMSDAMTVQEDLIVECLWRRAGTSDGLRDALRSLAIQPRTELGLRISGRQRSSDAIDT
jgi:hypothetical protein